VVERDGDMAEWLITLDHQLRVLLGLSAC
jgi:hypothetical protein